MEAKRTGQILRIQEENDEWLLMFDYIARITNSTSPSIIKINQRAKID